MPILFLIFLICLFLVYKKKKRAAFGLVVINLIFCFLVLLHHLTNVVQIRL